MAYITIEPIEQYLAYNGGTASYTVTYSGVSNLNVIIDQESDFIPTANLSGNTLTLTYNTTNQTFDQLYCAFTVAGTDASEGAVFANGTVIQKGQPGTITATYSADNEYTYLPYGGCTIIYDIVSSHVDLSTVATTFAGVRGFNTTTARIEYDSTNNQVLMYWDGDSRESLYQYDLSWLPTFTVIDYQGDTITCTPTGSPASGYTSNIIAVENYILQTSKGNDIFTVGANDTSIDISFANVETGYY